MRLLIIGGCGFLGSNLAAHGIGEGYDITVFDNLSRVGAVSNLEWLKSIGGFKFVHGDTRNRNDVERLIRNENYYAIFHLAGQVAMTTSIEDPLKDFEVNAVGTLYVLEAIRKYSPETILLFSSTNKVYGDLEQYHYQETMKRYSCVEWPHGFDESVPLNFSSPYGCSKGAADQYILDYSRIYGIKAAVFRHSSMYGGRQYSSYDQGWIGWFCQKAIEKKKNINSEAFTISGNGKQVRDILHANDMVRLYYMALQKVDALSGQAFNIGGGMEKSLSLLELFDLLEEILNVKLSYKNLPPRMSDQKVFVANTGKIKKAIGWVPEKTIDEGIFEMLNWTDRILK